ncbi:toll/interleukin-1 receptor domain-containing protein [Devosia faecipullorum]|uniref:toll/interleukin-1 receptor domain-containing protein n=1 Tax=Devosia faecipullorum TaxID=2755039 RepID=UPI00187BA857|nr:toll/interleukin-1 receptor domain-containing protein [Devosia faecipullorum]MBE7731676.1 toll/interleukin-1 receptor domain-containing protein [Devosia faecipullorum]
MSAPTRPFLVVYIVWHPAFEQGRELARHLFEHYRREHYGNVAGGAGLSVLYRFEADASTGVPIAIDLNEGDTTAVVVLFDEHFAGDAAYMGWLKQVEQSCDEAGLSARVFPVAMDASLVRVGIEEQGTRWDKWDGLEQGAKQQKLTSDLTYQFSRMLRTYLEGLKRPQDDEEALQSYLKKVQIFLSHSKRDNDGQRIAKAIRAALFENGGLSSFFDVIDIPTGIKFSRALLAQVRVSAVVAIHTDSFSSREWCRREIIEAKIHNVPLVVANCISDVDERGFPYMGNVPVVRMDPIAVDRIDFVVGRLLDEVLKDFLWRCRVLLAGDGAVFLPRPPELISLAGLAQHADAAVTLVYPDPPIGSEEQRLFELIAPRVVLRSLTEWIAQSGLKP